MVGYIGSKAVTLSTTAADVAGNAVIDGDLTVKGTTVTIDSAAAQEIRLGDNDKMTFGDATGGDLQIYHDGSNSYIDDVGTGGLIVRADNFYVRKANDVENMIIGSADGAVTLYHDNATKLATTSTGVDITGGVTTDAYSYLSGLRISGADTGNTVYQQSGDLSISSASGSISLKPSGTNILHATNTGVGIGTSSPTEALTVSGGNIQVDSFSRKIGFKVSGNSNAGYLIPYDGSGNTQLVNERSSGNLIFKTANTERMRIESNGRVAIGKTSATAMLDIDSTALTAVQVSTSQGYSLFNGSSAGAGARINIAAADASSGIVIAGYNDAQTGYTPLNYLAADHRYKIGSSEKARLDSSGNFVVGTTDDQPPTNNDANGIALRADGKVAASRSNGISGDFNTGVNGDCIWVRATGSLAGIIGAKSGTYGYMYLGSGPTAIQFDNAFDSISPVRADTGATRDNAIDFGTSAARYDDIYATNGTIQTSDQNEKQQIAALTDAEITAAKAISKLFKTFKWNDSVAEKGDAARTHSGVIAQEVEQAMTDAGLNAGDYAFFISTTWWETQTEVPAVEADEENGIEGKEAYTRIDTYHTSEEAPEGATERNRKGIRYPQLLSFIGAATEQRLASIESRLDALEGN